MLKEGETFLTYLGVRGLEEPMGDQLMAWPFLPAPLENKKSLLLVALHEGGGGRKDRGTGEMNNLYKLAPGRH